MFHPFPKRSDVSVCSHPLNHSSVGCQSTTRRRCPHCLCPRTTPPRSRPPPGPTYSKPVLLLQHTGQTPCFSIMPLYARFCSVLRPLPGRSLTLFLNSFQQRLPQPFHPFHVSLLFTFHKRLLVSGQAPYSSIPTPRSHC